MKPTPVQVWVTVWRCAHERTAASPDTNPCTAPGFLDHNELNDAPSFGPTSRLRRPAYTHRRRRAGADRGDRERQANEEAAAVNTFKFARDLARRCPDRDKRLQLVERCDECKEAFDRFCITADTADMQVLVARWTRLLVAIDLVDPLPDGGPVGAGRLRLPAPETFSHDPDIYDVIQKLTATG